MERTIIVAANQGNKIMKFEDPGLNTWGDVKQAIDSYNEKLGAGSTDFNQVEAVLGGSYVTLDLDDAQLPKEGVVKIFLQQKEGKSGGISPERDQAYARIRTLIERDGQVAANYFNSNGNLNYTNKRTALLWDLINNYSGVSDEVETPVIPGMPLQISAELNSALTHIDFMVLSIGDSEDAEAWKVITSQFGWEINPELAAIRNEFCEIASLSIKFKSCED